MPSRCASSRPELRGHRDDHELPDRHGPLEDIPRARGDRRTAAPSARDEQGQKVVTMKEKLSALIDGELEAMIFTRTSHGSERTRNCAAHGMPIT